MSNKYYLIYFLVLINIPAWAQDSSFTFNANDYVNITSDASLQAETGMTIECWVNPESDTYSCLLYTSPSPRDRLKSRMPSSA